MAADITDFRPDEAGAEALPQQAFRAQQMFSDPEYLRRAAIIAFENRQPQGFAFLERAHAAAKENAFEAAGHLLRGDGESAVAAWNKSGRFTDAVGAKDNGNGTWTISRKGGQTVTINPQQEVEGLLSPQQFVAMTERRAAEKRAADDKEEERGLRKRQLDILEKHYNGQDTAQETKAQAALAAAEARAAAAEKRATAGAGKGEKAHDFIKDRMTLRAKLYETGLRGAELDAELERGMRADLTAIVPDPENEDSFHILDRESGRVLRTYGSYPEAQEAVLSWVSGKGFPKKKDPATAKAAEAGKASPTKAASPSKGPRRWSFDEYAAGAVKAQKPGPQEPDLPPDDPFLRELSGYR